MSSVLDGKTGLATYYEYDPAGRLLRQAPARGDKGGRPMAVLRGWTWMAGVMPAGFLGGAVAQGLLGPAGPVA